MRCYRIFPHDSSAAEREPGGTLYVPSGGKGRIDSPAPGVYRVFYVGSTPECAVAEAFGAFDVWDGPLIEASPALPTLPRSRFALAAYDLPDELPIRNLDDARTLLEEELRPSHVVTRDRAMTQAWAARIHATRRYAGLSWWSYYEPSWQSIGIWNIDTIETADATQPLRVGDEHVRSAAATIRRRLQS